jgi:hypothetical protein
MKKTVELIGETVRIACLHPPDSNIALLAN